MLLNKNEWNAREIKYAVDCDIIEDDTRITQFLLYCRLSVVAFYDCMYTLKYNRNLITLLYYILDDLKFLEIDDELYRNVNEITEQYISFFSFFFLFIYK